MSTYAIIPTPQYEQPLPADPLTPLLTSQVFYRSGLMNFRFSSNVAGTLLISFVNGTQQTGPRSIAYGPTPTILLAPGQPPAITSAQGMQFAMQHYYPPVNIPVYANEQAVFTYRSNVPGATGFFSLVAGYAEQPL